MKSQQRLKQNLERMKSESHVSNPQSPPISPPISPGFTLSPSITNIPSNNTIMNSTDNDNIMDISSDITPGSYQLKMLQKVSYYVDDDIKENNEGKNVENITK